MVAVGENRPESRDEMVQKRDALKAKAEWLGKLLAWVGEAAEGRSCDAARPRVESRPAVTFGALAKSIVANPSALYNESDVNDAIGNWHLRVALALEYKGLGEEGPR